MIGLVTMNIFTNVIQGPARVLINDVGLDPLLFSSIRSFNQLSTMTKCLIIVNITFDAFST